MKTLLFRFLQDEVAGAAIEYSLVASIISLAIVAAAVTIGTSLDTILKNVSANF